MTVTTAAITIVRLPNHEARCPLERLQTTVGRVDLDLAESLHRDSGRPRPFSVVRRARSLDAVCFDDSLAGALLKGEPAARLVTRLAAEALIRRDAGPRVMRLALESPTHFRVAGLDHLVPDAFHLFGGLLDRWRALDWPALEPPDLRRLPVQLDRYLHASGVTANGRAQAGFQALLWLDLLPLSDGDRASLWTLARFGEYRGVGAHTSYGLGRMRLLRRDERWEPGACLSVWECA